LTRRLVYLPQAEIDLAGVYDLIAEDSPQAAISFIADIRQRCEPLADFPRMGRPLDDVLYRITFDRRAAVFYAFEEDSVWISGVRYLGRRYP
jgi:toxin ParE1/3/4